MTTTLSTEHRNLIGLAVHDGGHAVVGVLHGAKVDHAALADDGSDGLCRFTTPVLGDTPSRYRPEIAAAGAAAAAVLRHGPRPRLHQIEQLLGPGDRRELRLAAMANGAPFDTPILAVTPVIRRSRNAITKLAATLAEGREVRHRDVCQALGLSAAPGRAAFQLALLRSGSSPGSFSIR